MADPSTDSVPNIPPVGERACDASATPMPVKLPAAELLTMPVGPFHPPPLRPAAGARPVPVRLSPPAAVPAGGDHPGPPVETAPRPGPPRPRAAVIEHQVVVLDVERSADGEGLRDERLAPAGGDCGGAVDDQV